MPSNEYLSNQLLIAMPSMDDGNFARSVTLLCQHNDEGAMGLIINRATDFTMRELFSQLELECTDEQLNDQPVLWGGPVQTDRGFVLHRDLRDWPSTLRFGSGLAVTTSKEVLVSLAQGDGPKNPLIMLGYAGWEVGQLEQELVENSWLNAPVNDALLFETPYELRWQAAARQLGIDIQNMTDYSGHA